MSDSPIKQPSTCSGEHSFGFDSSNYQPSPWDALAGEDGGTKEPTAGRHGPAGAPTASQAAASNTSNTLTMRELFAAVAAAKQTESPPSPPAQDETYAVRLPLAASYPFTNSTFLTDRDSSTPPQPRQHPQRDPHRPLPNWPRPLRDNALGIQVSQACRAGNAIPERGMEEGCSGSKVRGVVGELLVWGELLDSVTSEMRNGG